MTAQAVRSRLRVDQVERGLAEEGKVALRNIRRDTMHDLRELVRVSAEVDPVWIYGNPTSRSF
jgi:ribosome recycling factor